MTPTTDQIVDVLQRKMRRLPVASDRGWRVTPADLDGIVATVVADTTMLIDGSLMLEDYT